MPFGVARHNFYKPQVSAAPLDPDALALKDAVITAGGAPSDGQVLAWSDLAAGLKADGVFSKLVALWPIYAETAVTSAGAYIDLVARLSATPVATPTWAGKDGVTFNGTTQYLNTNSLGGGTLNSQSFGFDLVTDKAASTAVDMGSSSTAGVDYASNISVKYSDGLLYAALNDGNSDPGRTAPTNTTAVYVISRTASTDFTIYKDGSSFAAPAITSTSVTDKNYCLGACLDKAGAAKHFSAAKYAMGLLATGLTATDASNLTTRWNTYKAAVP